MIRTCSSLFMVIPPALMKIQFPHALMPEIGHISMTRISGIFSNKEVLVCKFHLVAYKSQLSFPTLIPVAELEPLFHIE